jgi:hypothetical protein
MQLRLINRGYEKQLSHCNATAKKLVTYVALSLHLADYYPTSSYLQILHDAIRKTYSLDWRLEEGQVGFSR